MWNDKYLIIFSWMSLKMHSPSLGKYHLFKMLAIKKSFSPLQADVNVVSLNLNLWLLSFTISLSDLEKFLSVVETGLSQRVEEGDYKSLVEVMGHLLAVKERQSSTDAMFEPLHHTIALLKVYEQELPDVVYKQLEVNCHLSTSQPFPPGPFSLSWDRLITFSLCLPIAHLLSVLLLLAIHHLSLLSALHFPPSIHLPITISIFLSDYRSAEAAREMEQRAKAGGSSQAEGGATAGDRGGQSAPKVCRFRCGTARLQGAFSQQWTVQV